MMVGNIIHLQLPIISNTNKVRSFKAKGDHGLYSQPLRQPYRPQATLVGTSTLSITVSIRQVVRELLAVDGKHKVEIFRRANGTYGFEVLFWSDEPSEMYWIPVGRYSECVAPDLATAEAEARSRVEWLW